VIAWWWSWLLTIIGLTGMWIVGNKHRWGFLLNFGNQALWITYALKSKQLGFLPASLLWGALYLRNWLRWGRP
jgi:hypothetical protein